MIVLGEDEVDAGPLEVASEKQVRVRDDNCIRRSVGRVLGKGLDMGMRTGMRPGTINRQIGVELANKIQCATAKG